MLFRTDNPTPARPARQSFAQRLASWRDDDPQRWFDGSVHCVDVRLSACDHLINAARSAVADHPIGEVGEHLAAIEELSSDREALASLREDLLTGCANREAALTDEEERGQLDELNRLVGPGEHRHKKVPWHGLNQLERNIAEHSGDPNFSFDRVSATDIRANRHHAGQHEWDQAVEGELGPGEASPARHIVDRERFDKGIPMQWPPTTHEEDPHGEQFEDFPREHVPGGRHSSEFSDFDFDDEEGRPLPFDTPVYNPRSSPYDNRTGRTAADALTAPSPGSTEAETMGPYSSGGPGMQTADNAAQLVTGTGFFGPNNPAASGITRGYMGRRHSEADQRWVTLEAGRFFADQDDRPARAELAERARRHADVATSTEANSRQLVAAFVSKVIELDHRAPRRRLAAAPSAVPPDLPGELFFLSD